MSTARNWKGWAWPACMMTSLCVQPILTVTGLSAEKSAQPAISPALAALIAESLTVKDSPPAIPVLPAEVDMPAANNAAEHRTEAQADAPEVVEERYPNGKVKISRQVIQDAKGNYLNHGDWKMFDERGERVMEGQYQHDARCGVWNHWYAAGEVPMLRERPFVDYSPPFISQGQFANDTLHGFWIIYDAKHRKVCEIQFERGERQGRASWYYPNGQKLREMRYEQGILHGDVTDYKPDGSVARVDTYDLGRKQAEQVTYHQGKGNIKKTVSQVLEPALQPKTLDDWHQGAMATYQPQGVAVKHGLFTAWHPNGQIKMQGEYRFDLPVGVFVWHFANGQKAIEGAYEDGLQTGEWCWWHENGLRSIRGDYQAGTPHDAWTWWNTDGKVTQATRFSDADGAVVNNPTGSEEPRQAKFPSLFPLR